MMFNNLADGAVIAYSFFVALPYRNRVLAQSPHVKQPERTDGLVVSPSAGAGSCVFTCWENISRMELALASSPFASGVWDSSGRFSPRWRWLGTPLWIVHVLERACYVCTLGGDDSGRFVSGLLCF